MANLIYNSFKSRLAEGTADVSGTATLKLMLVTSAYTPDVDTHEFRSSVTNEVVGTGYTLGGAALVANTVTQDNTNDKATLDANDLTWTSSTITARAAVLYIDNGTAGTDVLVAYYDFTTDQISSSGDFTVQINVAGLMDIT